MEMEHNGVNMRHTDLPPELNALTDRLIGIAMDVHSILGPGLLERLYEDAMVYELQLARIPFERQVVVKVAYKDTFLSTLRLDLLVDRAVILELKSVARLPDWEAPQLVSQLRGADLAVGLIINFHHIHLRDGITRRINPKASRLSSPRPSASSETSAFVFEPKA